jgi:hypothetical protein
MSSLSENIRWVLDFYDFLGLIRNLSRLDPKVRFFGKHLSSIKNNVSQLGSETLLLFIAALFNNSHNERSKYHG